MNEPRIVLVIPALDEEEALPLVLADVQALQRETALLDEIIVVDNGSRDQTAALARRAGATVLQEPRRGYGAACLCALAYLHSRPPDVVVFMDGDRSDHAEEIPALVQPIATGAYDLVVGSRTLGQSERGALVPQARFGNWLATRLIRACFGHRYTDLGPFRAVRYRALESMGLTDRDFGWTIEMQIRALQTGARVTEVPVRYRRRVGRSKISGTLAGSWGAGRKILATLWRLRWQTALALALTASSAAAFDHKEWDALLGRYVDAQGRVAYRELQQKAQPALESYLQSLTRAAPDTWPAGEQLAFWINAYNAGMVWAVLQGESPEPYLGRAKVFKFWKFEVAGKERTLDEIEHEILRQRFAEPRIHFAIVCAATSCPQLRPEAYVAPKLEAQLEAQARQFINDPSRNRFDPQQGKLHLSKIFEWFRADFERKGTLRQFLALYVTDTGTRTWLLSDAKLDMEFLDYDWTLNAQPRSRPLHPSGSP